ncbi:unnamed protein product [marine sediment metagenome]|uniref:Uncharacterized protein n=1 Tax=marine sediment metagenome TaxID=412755 RepID=X1NW53_9ZZZZ
MTDKSIKTYCKKCDKVIYRDSSPIGVELRWYKWEKDPYYKNFLITILCEDCWYETQKFWGATKIIEV